MKAKKILGILALAGGVIMLFTSNYIKSQVLEGKKKISSAQKSVNQADSLFSLSPATKGVGKEITGSAQKKINAGKQDVQHYTELANQLQIGGFILIGAGLVILFVPIKRKR